MTLFDWVKLTFWLIVNASYHTIFPEIRLSAESHFRDASKRCKLVRGNRLVLILRPISHLILICGILAVISWLIGFQSSIIFICQLRRNIRRLSSCMTRSEF